METNNKNIKTFDQHLEKIYGLKETKERIDFELKAKSFAIKTYIFSQSSENSDSSCHSVGI